MFVRFRTVSENGTINRLVSWNVDDDTLTVTYGFQANEPPMYPIDFPCAVVTRPAWYIRLWIVGGDSILPGWS